MTGAVQGGFDEAVAEQSAQSSFWMNATVNYVCVSARMEYQMWGRDKPEFTDSKHIRHMKGTLTNKFRRCSPAPEVFINLTTAAGGEEFVRVPFDEVLHFVTFDSITDMPKKSVDELNVKVTDSECEIENVGEFSIVSEPDVWVGLEYYIETGAKWKETEQCLDWAISEMREQWAEANGYHSEVWTIIDVDDPEDTRQATLTVGLKEEEVTFELSPPEDITADSPLSNFLQDVGEGLLSNVEMKDVYVSFEEVEDECVVTNDIGLSLHQVDVKPDNSGGMKELISGAVSIF